MAVSEAAAAAALGAQQAADAALNSPPLRFASGDSLPTVGVASSPNAAVPPLAANPSLPDLMNFLIKQNERLNSVMEMMALDRKSRVSEQKPPCEL